MHVYLNDSTKEWYLPPLTPVTEENGYSEEEWGVDGRTDFGGPGYIVDFNEYLNSGLEWDQVYDRSLSELLYVDPDVGSLRIGAGDWYDPGFRESFTILGSYLRETVYTGGGNDVIHDTIDGYNEDREWSEGDFFGDQLAGGGGNDTYYVNSGITKLYEQVQGLDFSSEPDASGPDAGGIDQVIASVSFTLSDYIENLTLVGDAESGEGNGIDNVIKGNGTYNYLIGYGGEDLLSGRGSGDYLQGGDGSDVLVGGAGSDSMQGDAGRDLFVFRALDGPGLDRIFDFSSADALVTDAKLFDSNNDGVISVGKDKQYALGDGRFVKITNASGVTTTKLEYDGSLTIDGVEFFVYSTLKSAGTLAMVETRGFDLDSF